MQTNQRITEVTGKPAQMWGNVLIPTTGTTTVKIMGDIIQAMVKSGIETKDLWTHIQNADSVEIDKAPIYALLVFGVLLSLVGLGDVMLNLTKGETPIMVLIFLASGIACAGYAFTNKRRLLAIHSFCNTAPVFMTKPPETHQQIAANIMAIARQLNAPTPGSTNGRPAMAQVSRSSTAAQKTSIQQIGYSS